MHKIFFTCYSYQCRFYTCPKPTFAILHSRTITLQAITLSTVHISITSSLPCPRTVMMLLKLAKKFTKEQTKQLAVAYPIIFGPPAASKSSPIGDKSPNVATACPSACRIALPHRSFPVELPVNGDLTVALCRFEPQPSINLPWLPPPRWQTDDPPRKTGRSLLLRR